MFDSLKKYFIDPRGDLANISLRTNNNTPSPPKKKTSKRFVFVNFSTEYLEYKM